MYPGRCGKKDWKDQKGDQGRTEKNHALVWLRSDAFRIIFNYNVTGFDTTSRTAYVKSMDDYHAVLAEAENQAQDKGILFYRTEELERKTKNDAALYGYRSATQFSSLMNLDVSHFTRQSEWKAARISTV